jgi:hypothetical protein
MQTDLIEYFAEEIKTLPPALATSPLFVKLRDGVNAIRSILNNSGPKGPTPENVQAIHEQARELNLALRRAD